MTYTHLKIAPRKTLAAFMAIWLSGVVFLICCSTVNGESMKAEFCPLAAKTAHCDKAEGADSANPVVERTASETVDCCAFLPILFDKNRKIDRTEQPEAIADEPIAVRFFASPVVIRKTRTVGVTPHIPNRQNTFVKNCVFRI